MVVVVVVREGGRDERAGVADDHADRPKPSSSSSALRAAVSVRLPDAAPNQGGGQGRPTEGLTRSRYLPPPAKNTPNPLKPANDNSRWAGASAKRPGAA